MKPLIIPRTAHKPDVWRGGHFAEIYRDPADADYPGGHYRLWVGTATIERSADYSHFPNAERLHILLDGDGLNLHFRQPDALVALAKGEWHTFCGGRPLHAELLGAQVSAFNLIYRAGMSSSASFVDVGSDLLAWFSEAEAGVCVTQIVFVLPGPEPEPQVLVETDQENLLLGPGDVLVWDLTGPDLRELRLYSTPPARLLLVEVTDGLPQPTTSA